MRLILLYILKGKYRANRKMKSFSRKYNFLHIFSICLTYKRVYSTIATATTKITHTIIIIIFIERTLNTEHRTLMYTLRPLKYDDLRSKQREGNA